MKAEHCTMFGCGETFITGNYSIETCPQNEFELATGARACSEAHMHDREGRKVRRLRRLGSLQQEPLAVAAGLVAEEILSVVRRPRPPAQGLPEPHGLAPDFAP
jgi:hypothetical protein